MSNVSNAVLALCRAYYGKRLTKEKFDALISCDSVSELIASLREEAYYASFLETVAPEAFAVEDAIRRSLFSRYGSICRFEKAIGSRFFELFIVRAEIDELLRFILLLSGGQSGDYIIGLSPELSKRTDIDLLALASLKSFGELSAFLAGSRYEKVIASCLAFEKPSYLVFETAFERYYDEFLKELIRKCFFGKERAEVTELVAMQRDASFISKHIRRCKYYSAAFSSEGPHGEKPTFSGLGEKQLEAVRRAQSLGEISEALGKTNFRDLDLSDADAALRRKLVQKAKKQIRFSSNPGTVTYCYLILAENEIQNLTGIIEGVKYHIPADEIKQRLVI